MESFPPTKISSDQKVLSLLHHIYLESQDYRLSDSMKLLLNIHLKLKNAEQWKRFSLWSAVCGIYTLHMFAL